jgi:hypothetical protein
MIFKIKRFEKNVPLSFKFQVFMLNNGLPLQSNIPTSTTNSENTIDINMEESSANSNSTNTQYLHNNGFTQSMPVSSNFLYSL